MNYNGKKHLENFLPSVLASTYGNLRVVVADNASTDDSVDYVREHFPAIEILTHHQNEGFAGGYNWALKKVQSDYYVLLNSDVSVTPGWIEPIITIMEADRMVGACQPKLLSYHQPGLFEYAGAAGGWVDSLGYPFSRGRIFDVCEKDTQQYNETQTIFWASGAAMFVRANVYHELGGLDASFFAHQEEIDLCWRMQLAGYRVMACPSSVVYHVGAGTLPRGGRKVYLNFRNNLLMIGKNMPLAGEDLENTCQNSPWMRFLPGKVCLAGDTSLFLLAIFRAHLAVLKHLALGTQNPCPVPFAAINVNWKACIKRIGGIWEYFIKDQGRFRQISGKEDLRINLPPYLIFALQTNHYVTRNTRTSTNAKKILPRTG